VNGRLTPPLRCLPNNPYAHRTARVAFPLDGFKVGGKVHAVLEGGIGRLVDVKRVSVELGPA
jgi:hypothetical protein